MHESNMEEEILSDENFAMASLCLLEVFCRSFRYPQLTQQWITIFPMLLEGAASDIDRVKFLLNSKYHFTFSFNL